MRIRQAREKEEESSILRSEDFLGLTSTLGRSPMDRRWPSNGAFIQVEANG
jgi:hypothetical protein